MASSLRGVRHLHNRDSLLIRDGGGISGRRFKIDDSPPRERGRNDEVSPAGSNHRDALEPTGNTQSEPLEKRFLPRPDTEEGAGARVRVRQNPSRFRRREKPFRQSRYSLERPNPFNIDSDARFTRDRKEAPLP